MPLWRINPWRSARRRAHRELLQGRRDFGWPWTWRRARLYARRLDWSLPLMVGLLLSAPLAAYAGNAVGWLGSVWPVSAVLLGFVIPFVVFLLQAASDRSLRSKRTDKALIAESGVAWPTMFALVFLGWIGVIALFAGKLAAPSWVTTWSLVLFIAQLLGLLVLFARVRRLLSPAGVARLLERTLKADIEGSASSRCVGPTATSSST